MSKKSNILALCGSFCIFAGVLLFSETVYADTVTFNGSTYEVFEEGMTWTEAEEYCENLGGHLVVISSEEEQKFVSGLLSSRLEYYWIGGQYYRNIDEWLWVTGEDFQYTNWAPGQPDDGFSGGEGYLGITARNTSYAGQYKWNDYSNTGSASSLSDCGFICEWDELQVSVYNTPTKATTLAIYENKGNPKEYTSDYKLAEGVQVSDGTNMTITGVDGLAEIIGDEWKEITVSKNGFSSRKISKERAKACKRIYLQPVSDTPVINGVWIGNLDALNEDYAVDLTDTAAVTLEAEIDWGGSGAGTLELIQDGARAVFSGKTLTMTLKDKFDVSDTIYIRATDAKGRKTVKSLKIHAGGSVSEALDGFSFSLGKSIGITLPDSFPFVGGEKVSLDMATKILPVIVATEDNKVYVTIGIDLAEYTSKDNYATNAVTGNRAHILKKETKNAYTKIKEAHTLKDAGKSMAKVRNIAAEYKSALKYPKGSFAFSADFTVLGFAEGYLDSSGKFNMLDGGVIFNPSVSYNHSGQFAIGPVPCYWEFQIKAAIEGQWNLYQNEAVKSFMPSGEIEGTIGGSVGAGIGINKVATIGGGGELKFRPYAKLSNENYFRLTTSINAYFKAKIAFFEYRHDFKPIKEWVLEYPEGKGDRSINTPAADFAYYDLNNYRIENLSYLETGSEFYGNAGIEGIRSAKGLDSASLSTFKTNTYTDSAPKIAAYSDGRKIAVWLDGNSDDINAIHLYYSYFNGTAWSYPKLVQYDQTIDYAPDLVIYEDVAYLVWQNGQRLFSTEDTLSDIASNMGISAAVYDYETDKFQISSLAAGESGLNMQPQICYGNGKVWAVWLNNQENDWFGLNEKNRILASYYSGSSWGETEILQDRRNAIISFSAGYVGGEFYLAFCEEGDNDPTTTNDLQIYLNNSRMDDENLISSAPVIKGDRLYWYEDGQIVCRYLNTGEQISITEKGKVNTDCFRIEDDGDRHIILYTASCGLTSELYVIFEESNTHRWGQPQKLTDEEVFLSSFDAVCEKDSMTVLMNQRDVTGNYEDEDPYGSARLSLLTTKKTCNLSIEEVEIDESSIVPGTKLECRLYVKNSGEEAGKYKIHAFDPQGIEVGSVVATETVLPGDTQIFSYYYPVSEETVNKNISFELERMNGDENNTQDNRRDVMLSYQDLSLENTGWGERADGTVAIYTTVVNRGYQTAEALEVKLVENTAEGAVLKRVSISELESFDARTISFQLPYEKGKAYYLEVSGVQTDDLTANNTDFVILDRDIYKLKEAIGVDYLVVTKAKTSYMVGDVFSTSDLKVKAFYLDGTTKDVTNLASCDARGVNMKKAGNYICWITCEGKKYGVKIKVTEKIKPQDQTKGNGNVKHKKKISTLKVTAKRNSKKITVKTIKKSKIKISLSKKLLKKGKKRVKSITVLAALNKKGKKVFKLAARLPKRTIIKVRVQKKGYLTRNVKLKVK